MSFDRFVYGIWCDLSIFACDGKQMRTLLSYLDISLISSAIFCFQTTSALIPVDLSTRINVYFDFCDVKASLP